MNNTKTKESETKLVNFLMSNWKDHRTDPKLNYFRLLLEKYSEEKDEERK